MTSMISNLKAEFISQLYMYVPLTIILQSCVGSIAVMLILMHGTTWFTGIQMAICTIACMFYNASLLAQLRATISFWLLVVSLGVNTVLIIFNLI